MIEIVLPMPVSANVYYRNFNGRMVISPSGRMYAHKVMYEMSEQHPRLKPLLGRLKCEITLYPPDRRQRDLDNFCGKSLLDAMQKAGVYEDDSQIDALVIKRAEVTKGGMVKVKIEVIS